MGLHLPEAPPPDSDEEEDPEGAAAQRSRASIPMDAGQTPKCPLRAAEALPAALTSLPVSPSRSRGAGEEDDGGRGVAVSRRAVVGHRDLRRPVEGHGPEHPAEPAKRRGSAPRPQEQRQWTLNAPRHLH